MKQISIIKSTGNMMGDRVLGGVYGAHQPAEVEGGVAKFVVSPEFKRISHLFSYLSDGSAPIMPTAMSTIEVDDEFEHTAKAQLMHTLALRWEEMYSGMAPEQPGMLSVMLKGEAAQVSAGAKQHLLSMGMRAYMVPVTCNFYSASMGRYLKTERDLVADLRRSRPDNIVIVTDEAPTDLGTDPLTSKVSVAPRDSAPEPEAGQPEAAPAWEGFSGIEAHVRGGVIVVASSPEQAVKAAEFRLELARAGEIPMSSEVVVESVLSLKNRELGDYDPDFDEDEDRGRDSGSYPRD
jgi:hypothetical protein